MFDYEQHHYDKEKLRANSTSIGLIMIDQDADLEQVRGCFPHFVYFKVFYVPLFQNSLLCLAVDIGWSN